jgi:hypothetical protein
MMVKAPFPIPDPPTPAMARPMMNMGDDWAAAQRKDPSSKIMTKARKDHCQWSEKVRRQLESQVRPLGRRTAMDTHDRSRAETITKGEHSVLTFMEK